MDMNDIQNYLANKCLELISVELGKQAILEDNSLSPTNKQNLISTINAMSEVKNMADVCNILSELRNNA